MLEVSIIIFVILLFVFFLIGFFLAALLAISKQSDNSIESMNEKERFEEEIRRLVEDKANLLDSVEFYKQGIKDKR